MTGAIPGEQKHGIASGCDTEQEGEIIGGYWPGESSDRRQRQGKRRAKGVAIERGAFRIIEQFGCERKAPTGQSALGPPEVPGMLDGVVDPRVRKTPAISYGDVGGQTGRRWPGEEHRQQGIPAGGEGVYDVAVQPAARRGR